MPRSKSKYGRNEELIAFVCGKILQLKETLNLTTVEMAQVAGYDRASFHRMLRGYSLCNTEALYRLSVHYNLSMDYWFPPRENVGTYTLPKVVVREGTIPAMPLMTRQMISKLNKLPKDARRRVLVLALRSPELISDAIAVAKALAQATPEKKKRLVSAVLTLAIETQQPAP